MEKLRDEVRKKDLMLRSGYEEQFSFSPAEDTLLFSAEPGDYLIREGETPFYLYYLVSGRAKLYVTMSNGRQSLIDFFTAPCFIGEMELIDPAHEPLAVQAIDRCLCLALPIPAYRKRLLEDPLFLRKLCLVLSQKNFRNITSYTQNQSFPLLNRLAVFILLTENQGIYREKHTLTADHLGVSYRHLLYTLAELTKKGILERIPEGYAVRDPEALGALARVIRPDL